ncbi:MAG: prohibitin family protein [Cytophagales bacterium]|nr:MAG: prohibitin family protein [Cytophagales bacterium]
MKTIAKIVLLASLISLVQSCSIVRQDEVGVKRRLGRIRSGVYSSGVRLINPFFTRIIKLPVRTVNLEVNVDLPSKEGLTINTEISILYHIIPEKTIDILKEAGIKYETTLILPVFRSAVADVSARFFAKDMHSSKRAEIEQAVKEQMIMLLEKRGFVIESVLMKTVKLPTGLTRAVEDKLEAEQESQRMEFVLSKERMEAERLKIQAEGIKEYNRIISQDLTPLLLQFMSIEAFKDLSQSSNSKVIITDGKTPLLLNPEK